VASQAETLAAAFVASTAAEIASYQAESALAVATRTAELDIDSGQAQVAMATMSVPITNVTGRLRFRSTAGLTPHHGRMKWGAVA
jgi:hypothetical protein